MTQTGTDSPGTRSAGTGGASSVALALELLGPSQGGPGGGGGRLLSLDVFRGATVAGMILVNNPGSWSHVYWPLDHAEWHGCTPTDLVMPFFLFIVGVSIVFAMAGRRDDPGQHGTLLRRVAKRVVMLFLLAYVLGLMPSSPDSQRQWLHDPLSRFTGLRLMGVLQRIGLVYGACAVLYLKASTRTLAVTCGAILLLYWAALTLVPVPAEGGWSNPSLTPTGNLAAAIDRAMLTRPHLYKPHEGYDPEGLASTVCAVATGLMGVLAGLELRRPRTGGGTATARLLIAGAVMTGAGLLWSLVFPLNKQLWTSSYALFTGGLAAILLAALHELIDVRGLRTGTAPFRWFGVNAIAAFWGSGFLVRLLNNFPVIPDVERKVTLQTFIYSRWIVPVMPTPEVASLVYAIGFLLLWTGIVWVMFRMKWIWKV